MKKTILSLTLLLVFSTNINANEIISETNSSGEELTVLNGKIISEKSAKGKELERLYNWYFNEYLVDQKKQEKLINNQINNKPKNIK